MTPTMEKGASAARDFNWQSGRRKAVVTTRMAAGRDTIQAAGRKNDPVRPVVVLPIIVPRAKLLNKSPRIWLIGNKLPRQNIKLAKEMTALVSRFSPFCRPNIRQISANVWCCGCCSGGDRMAWANRPYRANVEADSSANMNTKILAGSKADR